MFAKIFRQIRCGHPLPRHVRSHRCHILPGHGDSRRRHEAELHHIDQIPCVFVERRGVVLHRDLELVTEQLLQCARVSFEDPVRHVSNNEQRRPRAHLGRRGDGDRAAGRECQRWCGSSARLGLTQPFLQHQQHPYRAVSRIAQQFARRCRIKEAAQLRVATTEPIFHHGTRRTVGCKPARQRYAETLFLPMHEALGEIPG